jgi:hypothetical protein
MRNRNIVADRNPPQRVDVAAAMNADVVTDGQLSPVSDFDIRPDENIVAALLRHRPKKAVTQPYAY